MGWGVEAWRTCLESVGGCCLCTQPAAVTGCACPQTGWGWRVQACRTGRSRLEVISLGVSVSLDCACAFQNSEIMEVNLYGTNNLLDLCSLILC